MRMVSWMIPPKNWKFEEIVISAKNFEICQKTDKIESCNQVSVARSTLGSWSKLKESKSDTLFEIKQKRLDKFTHQRGVRQHIKSYIYICRQWLSSVLGKCGDRNTKLWLNVTMTRD